MLRQRMNHTDGCLPALCLLSLDLMTLSVALPPSAPGLCQLAHLPQHIGTRQMVSLFFVAEFSPGSQGQAPI